MELSFHEYLGRSAVRTSVWTDDNTLTEFVRPAESYPVWGFSAVENDELIADVYQEELATKDAAEASEKSHGWFDWLGSYSDPWSAEAVRHNDYDDPNSNYIYDLQQSSEDEDEDEHEHPHGEIGKRLPHMDSVPHIPKINGEIPTVDDATDAHQRLLDRCTVVGISKFSKRKKGKEGVLSVQHV